MIGNHKKAVLQFSGGKDSLAALYLVRPWLDKIEVHWCDTGAILPEQSDFIRETCEKLGARLKIIKSGLDIVEYHKEYGLPSDIVPDNHAVQLTWMLKDKPETLVQSTLTCCAKMIWLPLHQALLDSGATACIRGVRDDDELVGIGPGVHSGIEYISPVWDWTDSDVFGYLKEQGCAVPRQYPQSNASTDCWLCTGFLGAHYAKSRMTYIKKHYPELMPELSKRASLLKGVLHSELDKVDEILEIAINA